jgi:hypothetical protein
VYSFSNNKSHHLNPVPHQKRVGAGTAAVSLCAHQLYVEEITGYKTTKPRIHEPLSWAIRESLTMHEVDWTTDCVHCYVS